MYFIVYCMDTLHEARYFMQWQGKPCFQSARDHDNSNSNSNNSNNSNSNNNNNNNSNSNTSNGNNNNNSNNNTTGSKDAARMSAYHMNLIKTYTNNTIW